MSAEPGGPPRAPGTPPSGERIGFIGLGLMGQGMARNLLAKGYPLTVTAHHRRAAVDDLVAHGAFEAGSTRELAQRCSIVFLCVTGSPQVEALIRAPDGLKAGLQPGALVVDCSTSDPVSTVALAAELAQIGVELVDAPLGRTPREAWAGTLDTMVGASEATFARLQPVLATWAGRAVHIGACGDGHRMKLLNNFLSLGYAALYSEALALAAKVGITPARFDSVIRGGRMDCGFYQTFMRYTLEGDRNAHPFALSNGAKDLRYLASMADAAGVANPLGAAVKNSFVQALANGGQEDLLPMLARHVAALNGVDLGIPDPQAAASPGLSPGPAPDPPSAPPSSR